jgi:exonuclease III
MCLSANPPHTICLTEHHLDVNEIDTIVLANYSLGAKFCRNALKNGGVSIFTHGSIHSTNINLNKFCKEKDLEICAVKLHLPCHKICIITIYRSRSGNFQYFIDNLEKILSIIYINTTEIIICGDININYLNDSTHKQLLDSLLASYGLCSTVQFPTRIQNTSHSPIDNIFINTLKFSDFSLYPIINRLSDHDTESIIVRNIFEQNRNAYFYFNKKN